jgi:hypothetical protein
LSRSKRKVAADHFREQIRRSNEFHVAYLEDAKFLRGYGALPIGADGIHQPNCCGYHESPIQTMSARPHHEQSFFGPRGGAVPVLHRRGTR